MTYFLPMNDCFRKTLMQKDYSFHGWHFAARDPFFGCHDHKFVISQAIIPI
jgi:hypothetical protein